MDTMIRNLQRKWNADPSDETNRLKLVSALQRKLNVDPCHETIMTLHAARIETQMTAPNLTEADMKRGPRPNAGMAHETEMQREARHEWEEEPLCETQIMCGILCQDYFGFYRRCNVCYRKERHRRAVVRLILARNWEEPKFVSFDETKHGATCDANDFDFDPYYSTEPQRYWSVTRNCYVWRESRIESSCVAEYVDATRKRDWDLMDEFDHETNAWR